MVFQTTPPREIDTNALVHAQREELEKHDAAQALIRRLSDGDTPWAIPVFCISEFPRVVTNRRFFRPPTTLDVALDTINVLLESLSVQLLGPGDRYWPFFRDVMHRANVSGNLVYDAQIVTVCLERGFQTIVSEDRDMLRIEGIEVVPIA